MNILLNAFPYQKFWAQTRRISQISDVPFSPGELQSLITFDMAMYQVRVDLDKQTITAYGNEVPLKPGMTLQDDIVTDTRSLLEWMFDPLFALRRG